nr:auxin-responsive protein saur71 [Quercus suber]
MEIVEVKCRNTLIFKAWKRCLSLVAGNKKCCSPSSTCTFSSLTKRKKNRQVAPEGCFAVYVGPQKQRFVIKTKLVNHPLFAMLLEDAELEYGYNSEGPLVLPCDVDLFYKVLAEMDSSEDFSPGCGFAKGYSLILHRPARRSNIPNNQASDAKATHRRQEGDAPSIALSVASAAHRRRKGDNPSLALNVASAAHRRREGDDPRVATIQASLQRPIGDASATRRRQSKRRSQRHFNGPLATLWRRSKSRDNPSVTSVAHRRREGDDPSVALSVASAAHRRRFGDDPSVTLATIQASLQRRTGDVPSAGSASLR